MSVQHVEVIVEEPSAEAALQSLLPTLLGEVSFLVHAHQGKAELLKRLPDRLRGYALRRKNDPWFRDHCRVVVLVDRDDDDCIELKKKLEKFAADAGLMSRRSSKARPYVIATRVAIEVMLSPRDVAIAAVPRTVWRAIASAASGSRPRSLPA